MTGEFDRQKWFERIGYSGPATPELATLKALVTAHATTIAYESIDVLMDRPPSFAIGALQAKMIDRRRGGYCFEQNMLFRAGLRSLGFEITSLQARVIRGLAIDATRPMLHMVLRIDLPEGVYFADVGFGNVAPTTALKLVAEEEQETPHETMRFIRLGDEFVLQSKLGEHWQHIYRVVMLPRLDAEYEMCNWFTATHPASLHTKTMIAARPGPHRTRLTLYNGRFSIRHVSGETERRMLTTREEFSEVLAREFGLILTDEELRTAFANMTSRAGPGEPHPFFA
jgi:N-hydroxyarylamine O-acetyltransferase